MARYGGYLNDPEMSPLRQQMEVDFRKADAEHTTSTRIAEEKAAAERERAAQLAKRHRDPEPGSLPAVASGAPVGVDSTAAAAEVLEGLANYFNTPEVK